MLGVGHGVILRNFTRALSLDQVADFGRINYECHSFNWLPRLVLVAEFCTNSGKIWFPRSEAVKVFMPSHIVWDLSRYYFILGSQLVITSA